MNKYSTNIGYGWINVQSRRNMGKIELECDCDIVHEDHVNEAKKSMLDESYRAEVSVV